MLIYVLKTVLINICFKNCFNHYFAFKNNYSSANSSSVGVYRNGQKQPLYVTSKYLGYVREIVTRK